MRHRVKTKKFNRHTESRKALVKSLACALFEHGKIETTLPKAKYLRPVVEKIITRAKNLTLHNKRLLIASLQNKKIVDKLFDEIGPSFKDRNGGYTRIQRTRVREGDVTQMASISLIEDKKIEEPKEKIPAKSTKKVVSKKSETKKVESSKK